MARESCNLDKDEAEILKPSSSFSPPSPPPASPTPLSSSPPQPSPMFIKSSQEFLPQRMAAATPETRSFGAAVEANRRAAVQCVKRCFGCQKRVGLTAFRCRCGHLFCPRHRYSDSHDCSFDYKAAGRAEISKNNPLIRAAKIIKI